jgi:hypothetical protein
MQAWEHHQQQNSAVVTDQAAGSSKLSQYSAPNAPDSSKAPSAVSGTGVMFGVIGRDVADELPYVLANIAGLAVHFKEAHVIFVENDSADNTRAVFTAWSDKFIGSSRNRTAKLLTFQPVSQGKKALKVLAQARNCYLDQLALPAYAGVDFLITVDTDMCFPWDMPGMLRVLNDLLPAAGRDWHALYANGACGWYASVVGNKTEEVPFNTPGELAGLQPLTRVLHCWPPGQ